MNDGRLEGLRAAVAMSPDNHALRLVLAESLLRARQNGEALDHFNKLLEADRLPVEDLVEVGIVAIDAGRLQVAARCLSAAKQAGVVGGTADLEAQLTAALTDTGALHQVNDTEERLQVAGLVADAEHLAFADVGGLDEVKKAIHRTIVLPFQRPDLYERYGRRAGGGVLLYGPPGCGKTMLARATAGECGVPFLNLRIEDVLDPHYGVSERQLHLAFEEARELAPCVLFVDELDAFAYARRKQQGSAGRALVDQLLQELDAIGSQNDGLLVLAATNAPWDIDDALKRPGRFDRVVFVPPPDREARKRIVQLAFDGRPSENLDANGLAEETELFSGADLRALVDRAIDLAIDDALDTGADVPIGPRHVASAREALRPTTSDWLRTARNYVEFANEAGRYDDVLEYLERTEVKALMRRRG